MLSIKSLNPYVSQTSPLPANQPSEPSMRTLSPSQKKRKEKAHACRSCILHLKKTSPGQVGSVAAPEPLSSLVWSWSWSRCGCHQGSSSRVCRSRHICDRPSIWNCAQLSKHGIASLPFFSPSISFRFPPLSPCGRKMRTVTC